MAADDEAEYQTRNIVRAEQCKHTGCRRRFNIQIFFHSVFACLLERQ